jgi:hypothetical protein
LFQHGYGSRTSNIKKFWISFDLDCFVGGKKLCWHIFLHWQRAGSGSTIQCRNIRLNVKCAKVLRILASKHIFWSEYSLVWENVFVLHQIEYLYANLCEYLEANMKQMMRINGICKYTETCEYKVTKINIRLENLLRNDFKKVAIRSEQVLGRIFTDPEHCKPGSKLHKIYSIPVLTSWHPIEVLARHESLLL